MSAPAPLEGVIIQDEETFGEFLEALASITQATPFRVRLVSTQPDAERRCAISIGDSHWIAGPDACRAVADVIAESVTMSAVGTGGPDFYPPNEKGIVQALRDCAERMEVKRLN